MWQNNLISKLLRVLRSVGIIVWFLPHLKMIALKIKLSTKNKMNEILYILIEDSYCTHMIMEVLWKLCDFDTDTNRDMFVK